MLHKFGWPFRLLYPSFEWKKPISDAKTIFLTFDDGPVPVATEFVLDTLRRFHIKATFFCVGDNVVKHPGVFDRLMKEGHRWGNHTYHHLNGRHHSTGAYLENVERCQQQLPVPAKEGLPLFRPPYGRLKLQQAQQLKHNYRIIMWDVLTGDYNPELTPKKCLKNAVRATENGSIVLCHDSMKTYDTLSYVLPRYIETMLTKGYQFNVL